MRREKGTGSIYKRDGSPVWWIKYHRHGRPFRESTQTTDYNKAGKMLKTRLSEINQGTFMGPQLERTKVDELAEMFLRDYRINGRKSLDDVDARWKYHLKPFFGGMRAVDLTSEQVSSVRGQTAAGTGSKRDNQPRTGGAQTDVPAW